MRVLITGVSGFAGSHLADFLKSREEIKVYGLRRQECNLCDAVLVQKMIDQVRPDRIFHLAAQAVPRFSLDHPQKTFMDNVIGTLNLLEAVRQSGLRPRILVSGSSEEYGAAADKYPLDESAPLMPLSPYAASKVSQSFLAYQYFLKCSIPIVRTRAFNHAGPRQSTEFVASRFAKRIATIERQPKDDVIKVGNLEPVKDFTDVRDVVRAYWLALEKGEAGEVYNICSGQGRKISEVLDFYLGRARVKNIKVEKDESLLRPGEILRSVGDPKKLMKQTGWKPEIPFEKTLQDTLDYWREHVKNT